MQIEDEIHFELGGQWWNIQLVEAESKTIPWRAWMENQFLAGGKTREAAIEAAKVTIDNRLNPKMHKVEGGFWG
jgi:hypothetical protein